MRADCISLAHRLGAIDYQIINSCTAGMIDSGSTRFAASRCSNPQCVTWAVCSGIVIDIGSERTICSGFVEGFNMLLFSDKHSAMWKHSYVCANEVEQVHNQSPTQLAPTTLPVLSTCHQHSPSLWAIAGRRRGGRVPGRAA